MSAPLAIALSLVLTSTAPVPVDLFRDYSDCTLGRESCESDLRLCVKDLAGKEALVALARTTSKEPAQPGLQSGFSGLEVLGIASLVAAVGIAGGVMLGLWASG